MDAPFKLPLRSSTQDWSVLYDRKGAKVGMAFGSLREEQNARRDRIIRCVNAHPKLVEACKLVVRDAEERSPDGHRTVTMLTLSKVCFALHEALADPATKEAGHAE